jgi:hypothetical protein
MLAKRNQLFLVGHRWLRVLQQGIALAATSPEGYLMLVRDSVWWSLGGALGGKMQEYSISKFSRKCATSGRPLQPGESYFSVISAEGEAVVRLDIAADQWNGPPESAVGWWRSTIPKADVKSSRPAPNGVLLDTLSELCERPGKEALAYLLALVLVRRRVLMEEQRVGHDVAPESATHWNLICAADGRQWSVPVIALEASQLSALQEELNGLLFTEV